MNLLWLLVILILIGSIGSAPAFGWHQYGYYPMGGGFGLLVIILIVLALTGRL